MACLSNDGPCCRRVEGDFGKDLGIKRFSWAQSEYTVESYSLRCFALAPTLGLWAGENNFKDNEGGVGRERNVGSPKNGASVLSPVSLRFPTTSSISLSGQYMKQDEVRAPLALLVSSTPPPTISVHN